MGKICVKQRAKTYKMKEEGFFRSEKTTFKSSKYWN